MKRIALYSVQKLTKLITLLVAVSILSFLLVSYSPIDPVRSYIGADISRVSPEQQKEIADYWGQNEPKYEQFLNWGKAVLHGNLGTSLLYRTPVKTVILDRLLLSLLLLGTAWLLFGIFGFILGVVAGMKKGTLIDKLIKGYCFMLASTPGFWIGLLLLLMFSVWLGWFPVGLGTPAGVEADHVTFLERLWHLFLPALTLSVVGVANVALHTREKLIDVWDRAFVQFARARGETGWTLLWRHGLRNISLPAISLHFASFGEIFGGAILAEQVFAYPGLGQAVVQAGLGGDVPLLLGITLFSTLFVFTGNLLADILYKVVDPRIRRVGRL